jgi:hypothetical protein
MRAVEKSKGGLGPSINPVLGRSATRHVELACIAGYEKGGASTAAFHAPCGDMKISKKKILF